MDEARCSLGKLDERGNFVRSGGSRIEGSRGSRIEDQEGDEKDRRIIWLESIFLEFSKKRID